MTSVTTLRTAGPYRLVVRDLGDGPSWGVLEDQGARLHSACLASAEFAFARLAAGEPVLTPEAFVAHAVTCFAALFPDRLTLDVWAYLTHSGSVFWLAGGLVPSDVTFVTEEGARPWRTNLEARARTERAQRDARNAYETRLARLLGDVPPLPTQEPDDVDVLASWTEGRWPTGTRTPLPPLDPRKAARTCLGQLAAGTVVATPAWRADAVAALGRLHARGDDAPGGATRTLLAGWARALGVELPAAT